MRSTQSKSTRNRKAFCNELHAKYDQLAKKASTKHLELLGFKVSEPENKYIQDLIAERDDQSFMVETEVKLIWKGDVFPYYTIQLPQRKEKFFLRKTLFYIWNEPLTHAATFWSHKIKHLKPVEVHNKYIHKGEFFYQIPLELVKFIKL